MCYSWNQLNGSGQAGPKWQYCSDFPSCSESAEMCHVDSFCGKNVRVFFSRRQKHMDKIMQNSPPPPPSLSISKQCRILILHLSQNTVCVRACMHCTLLEGGGGGCEIGKGGGWTFKNVFETLFPRLWKKNRDVFSQKKNLHGKFQWILSNLENHYKFVTWGRLLQTQSIYVKLFTTSPPLVQCW